MGAPAHPPARGVSELPFAPHDPNDFRGRGAHSPPNIEKWVAYRENYHRYFKLTPGAAFRAVILIGVVPFGIYTLVKRDMRVTDKLEGREGYKYL
mmetsp:Transcript_6113/g.20868  ORF Transcript_6113/g.20868 Transcript_6113/m.20868 type:complete len:95 (-) Transcript_6113:482-766(-)